MQAVLKLFKAVVIDDVSLELIKTVQEENKIPDSYHDFTLKTMKKGYIISPVVYAYKINNIKKLCNMIEKNVISFKDWNNSFYKNWKKVETMSEIEFRLDQFLHYLTTYGFDSLGIDSDYVYIPEDKLKIPNLKEAKFTYIKPITESGLKEKISNLVYSGIALKEETQLDILEILKEIKFSKKELLEIKNKELKAKIYKEFDIVPKDGVEFLRYCISLIDESVLIKNDDLINKIKENNGKFRQAFSNYLTEYDYKGLSEIFLRFKPIFLAFKSDPYLRTVINTISRKAKKYHKPLPEDFLNTITVRLREENFDFDRLKKELKKVNSFRKIRLLYSIKMITTEDVVYTIRNGKSWTTKRKVYFLYNYDKIYSIIEKSLIKDLKRNVKDKTFYIPEVIDYALPSSEKMFIGNIPFGTVVNLTNNAQSVLGVHWTDYKSVSIDLDLSAISLNKVKIGWDANFRNDSVTFSGDITKAPLPKGASEFLKFKTEVDDDYIIQLNWYDSSAYTSIEEIPFSLILGEWDNKNLIKNYMLDPSKIILQYSSTIGKQQKALGFIRIKNKKSSFIFGDYKVAGGDVASNNNTLESQINFRKSQIEERISFIDLLKKAGAKIINDKENIDFDFSPKNLTKESFITLFN